MSEKQEHLNKFQFVKEILFIVTKKLEINQKLKLTKW